MHMKAPTYIRCFIDMNLYNNFNEETYVEVLWKKIEFMFENKNAINRVSVFQGWPRYQDGSSMAKHLNAFQELINQTALWKYP